MGTHVSARTPLHCRAAGGRPAARLWDGEKRRSGVGARSAPRGLTRRACPSAANAVSAASCAARPRSEHRSAVGAQRRPSQWSDDGGPPEARPHATVKPFPDERSHTPAVLHGRVSEV